MKLNKTYLFITISSVALLAVLIIQVNWILQTARMKEELFNEKANMVLSKTAEALTADKETFKNIETGVGGDDVRKIDSIFNYYMKFYKIQIGYFFEVKPGIPETKSGGDGKNIFFGDQPNCYKQCLPAGQGKVNGTSGAGVELKLVFPDKEEFIIEEMGGLFIASVILILIVLLMFWKNTASLIKEKEISEHTTDFLNNMTHEFKTPLTNIGLAGKMIIRDMAVKQNVQAEKQDDKIKHYSEIILEENEKLRLQVEQVLSMTALERGEIPLQKTELDFHGLIENAIKCISIQVENQDGHLQVKLDAAKYVVMGDQTHLTNALCNLIDNAIKYSRAKPEISVITSNSPDSLIIEVADRGIGIEKAYHKKVFEKFFRVPTGDLHDVKGFGLGLAYIKKIIELHGGTIALRSNGDPANNPGATFTITLPHV
ncbi:MAG: HAMP domain-containing sensor histidine kinase [Bacteroidota bacterium]